MDDCSTVCFWPTTDCKFLVTWNLWQALSAGKSPYRTLRILRLSETPKRESDMGSRREAANHEAQTQERAYPTENKARPSRLGECQDRRDRKLEVVRIAAQLSAFDR